MLLFEMEEKLRKKIIFIMLPVVTLMLMTVSCGVKKEIDLEPYEDEFFEKTRLIMLKKEIKISN